MDMRSLSVESAVRNSVPCLDRVVVRQVVDILAQRLVTRLRHHIR